PGGALHERAVAQLGLLPGPPPTWYPRSRVPLSPCSRRRERQRPEHADGSHQGSVPRGRAHGPQSSKAPIDVAGVHALLPLPITLPASERFHFRSGWGMALLPKDRAEVAAMWFTSLRRGPSHAPLQERAQVLRLEHRLVQVDLPGRDHPPPIHFAQRVVAFPDPDVLVRGQACAVGDEVAHGRQLIPAGSIPNPDVGHHVAGARGGVFRPGEARARPPHPPPPPPPFLLPLPTLPPSR